MAEFLIAVKGVLEREGGYVKDPDDHGGATKYGISQRSYPQLDIEMITREDAVDIYDLDFWNPLRCNEIIDQVLANCLFDFGVNAGLKQSVKVMQAVAGVSVDGFIGPITMGAINEKCVQGGAEILALRFTLCRIAFYSDLAARRKSQRKFLPGWINRALKALND